MRQSPLSVAARTLLLGGLIVSVTACGAKKDKLVPATSSIGSGDATSAATSTVAGGTGGGSTTSVAGASLVTPGFAFSAEGLTYTLKGAAIGPNADDTTKKTLTVDFATSNKGAAPADQRFVDYVMFLDNGGSVLSAAGTKSSDGQVAPGATGTFSVTFAVAPDYTVAKSAVVFGDAKDKLPARVPLGSGVKGDDLSPVKQAAAGSVSGLTGGAKGTVNGVIVHKTTPVTGELVKAGQRTIEVDVTLTGATTAVQLFNYEVKLQEPDGAIVDSTSFVSKDKNETGIPIAVGQTLTFGITFDLKDATKQAGSYELNLPPVDGGQTSVKATFTLT